MIRLERTKMTPAEFGEVFTEGFGDYKNELPQTIYMVYDDDKRVAFCSVYVHSHGSLYLQYVAFTKEAEKKYGYYVGIIEALHKLGFPFIMGAISNRNNRALMWALKSGFIIHGIRVSAGGEMFVEVFHYRQEEG